MVVVEKMGLVGKIRRRLSRFAPNSLLIPQTLRGPVGTDQIIKQFLKLKLEPKRQLKLLDRMQIETTLDLPGCELKFSVSSMTEYGRVTRLKEPWTADWVQSLPKNSVLWDVGANIGLFSVLAASTSNVDFVVSIEPSSLNVRALYRNAGLNGLREKIVVVAAGLGEETGMRFLNLQNEKPGGALHSFGDVLYAGGDKKVEVVGREPSFLYRLDDLAGMDGMPFPTHIKIDVDGFEMGVLKGAPKTLADPRLEAIQVEVMEPVGETALREAMENWLSQFGFALYETIHHGDRSIATDLRFRRNGQR